MKKTRDLHISDNIEALDTLAINPIKDLKLTGDKVTSSTKKLFNEFQNIEEDMEKAYIIGKRYLYFLAILFRTTDDKKYTELRYGNEQQKVQEKMDELKRTLELRYQNLSSNKASEVSATQIEPEPITPEQKVLVPGNFITCRKLYELMGNNSLEMLLIDIRPAKEFTTSQINYRTCVNIPETSIAAGLSANTLGQKLPVEVQVYWDRRDSYDLLVLIDWNSNSENVCTSKLEMLKSCIVEWDFNRKYKHHPLFLSGGFKEFLDTYPAQVTNAHTYLVHKNDELDELLEIDNVIYPDTENNVQAPAPTEVADANNLKELINETVKEESKTDISLDLDDDEEEPRTDSPEPSPPPPEFISEVEPPSEEESTVDKMLREARAKKPKVSPVPKRKVPQPPVINRNIKPTHLRDNVTGFVGLKNIRNTCYMNTVVQCLRVLPVIKRLFLSGFYQKFITNKKPKIINELASLMFELWGNNECFLTPTDFYNKVCAADKMYKRGDHEDCMEFFMFLINRLSEDCIKDMPRPEVLTPKLEAKICQLLGKTSIFVDLFFHEVRNHRYCNNCNTSSYSFELDNTLMLPLPQHEGRLSDIIDEYFQEYSIPDYCCSKCKKPVKNKREIVDAPAILVIVLKRYGQLFQDGNQSFFKNDNCIAFEPNLEFGRAKYKLFSFAMHQGSLKAGHYTAGCLLNNKWFEMNDEIVRPLNIRTDMVRSKVCSFFYLREDTFQM